MPLPVTNKQSESSPPEHHTVQMSTPATVSKLLSFRIITLVWLMFYWENRGSLSHEKEICWTGENTQSQFSQLVAVAPCPALHTLQLPAILFAVPISQHLWRIPSPPVSPVNATSSPLQSLCIIFLSAVYIFTTQIYVFLTASFNDTKDLHNCRKMSGTTAVFCLFPHNFKCRAVWNGSCYVCMSSCVSTRKGEEIWKDTPLCTILTYVNTQAFNLNYHELRHRMDKTASTQWERSRGRGSSARRYYDHRIMCCGQIYLLDIYYFIHSLNRNGLIGFTGTTAAVLVYSFCWQPHQIEQRGKRKWIKPNFKEEQNFCVLMLVWPS